MVFLKNEEKFMLLIMEPDSKYLDSMFEDFLSNKNYAVVKQGINLNKTLHFDNIESANCYFNEFLKNEYVRIGVSKGIPIAPYFSIKLNNKCTEATLWDYISINNVDNTIIKYSLLIIDLIFYELPTLETFKIPFIINNIQDINVEYSGTNTILFRK